MRKLPRPRRVDRRSALHAADRVQLRDGARLRHAGEGRRDDGEVPRGRALRRVGAHAQLERGLDERRRRALPGGRGRKNPAGRTRHARQGLGLAARGTRRSQGGRARRDSPARPHRLQRALRRPLVHDGSQGAAAERAGRAARLEEGARRAPFPRRAEELGPRGHRRRHLRHLRGADGGALRREDAVAAGPSGAGRLQLVGNPRVGGRRHQHGTLSRARERPARDHARPSSTRTTARRWPSARTGSPRSPC